MNRIFESIKKFLSGTPSKTLSRLGWYLVGASWLTYILLFPSLYRKMGPVALSFSGFPVFLVSWHVGMIGGSVSALLITFINWILMYILGEKSWSFIIQHSLYGFSLLLFGGAIVGRMRDLSVNIRNELSERERTARKFRSIVERSIDGIILVDEDGRIIEWNHGQEEITGLKREDTLGMYIWDVFYDIHPDTQKTPTKKDQMRKEVLEAVETGEGYWLNQLSEREIQQKDGTRFYIQIRKYSIPTDTGFMIGIFSRDITERNRTEKLLLESEERFRATISQSSDGILVADEDLKIIEWSSSQTEIFGYTREEMLNTPVWQFQYNILPEENRPPGFLEHIKKRANEMKDSGEFFEEDISRDLEVQDKDGNRKIIQISSFPIKTSSGKLFGSIIRDISEQKKFEQHLQHVATHDSLTDLPNRTLLLDRLAHSLANAERKKEQLAVLYIDLDNFKDVNDTFGHAVGDTLLKKFTERVNVQTRKSDTFARISGDEFIMILESLNDAEQASRVAEKVIELGKEPFQVDNNTVQTTISVGISLYPENGTDHLTLLQNADAAMYQAKRAGKNNVQFYHG